MTAAVSVFRDFVYKVSDKPLMEVLNDIKTGTYKTEIDKIRHLMSLGKEEEAETLKKQLLGFAASGVFDNYRSSENLEVYTQFIILDIDKLSESELNRIIPVINLAPYTYACFISTRGKGVKFIVRVNSNVEQHKTVYNQVVDYYEQALNTVVDTSGSDYARLCFMSYDENCYINTEATIFEIQEEEKQTIIESDINTNNHQQLSIVEILNKCEAFTNQKGEYHEGNRNNYIYLFSANACRFGVIEEDAYQYCIANFDLSEKEIKTTVRSAYKSNNADFAKFAKFANATVSEEVQNQDSQNLESLSLLTTTPTVPEDVYNSLPIIFQKGIEVLKTQREKDVFLTGALSILSGCLPNVLGLYGGKEVYPNLFSFLLAPAASGKGALTYAKMLADKYHQAVIQNSKDEEADYKKELEAQKQAKKYLKKGEEAPEEPTQPPFKVVYIPANTSNAKMIKHIEDNEGFGIICETEADTLGQTFKNDWGSYSDLLRKAYHHEKISISRKTNNEYFEIDNPRLSVVLSGTPNQILNIIQSAEDGLFSRFMFYVFASNPEWLDPSPKSNPVNLTEHFKHLSDEVYRMVRYLDNTVTNIHLSDTQWQKFNPLFDEYLFRIYNLVSKDATSVVKRLGLMVFRFCMMFTAIRKYECQLKDTDLECTDQDFKNALKLADVYLQHSILVFKNLPNNTTNMQFKPTSPKANFFKELPQEFSRKQAVSIGDKLKIKERTVDNYLAKLEQAGYLVKPKAGYYKKIKSL